MFKRGDRVICVAGSGKRTLGEVVLNRRYTVAEDSYGRGVNLTKQKKCYWRDSRFALVERAGIHTPSDLAMAADLVAILKRSTHPHDWNMAFDLQDDICKVLRTA